jgi:hypothetical protein
MRRIHSEDDINRVTREDNLRTLKLSLKMVKRKDDYQRDGADGAHIHSSPTGDEFEGEFN